MYREEFSYLANLSQSLNPILLKKIFNEILSPYFSLIIDDYDHRKSGNFTDGIGRQYIGEVGKTDNRNVIVTIHISDGVIILSMYKFTHRYSISWIN